MSGLFSLEGSISAGGHEMESSRMAQQLGAMAIGCHGPPRRRRCDLIADLPAIEVRVRIQQFKLSRSQENCGGLEQRPWGSIQLKWIPAIDYRCRQAAHDRRSAQRNQAAQLSSRASSRPPRLISKPVQTSRKPVVEHGPPAIGQSRRFSTISETAFAAGCPGRRSRRPN